MTAPTLTDLSDSISLTEAQANAGYTPLDADVTVTDPYADFSFGGLEITGLLAEDDLTVIGGGSGATRIGFDNTTGEVSYAGAVFAETARVDDGTFVVLFAPGTTPAMVESLIEHIGYRDSSDTPTADRTLTFTLIDSSGDSTSADMGISVGAGNDAPHVSGPSFISGPFDGDVLVKGLKFSDSDAGSADVQVTLSTDSGQFKAAATSDVAVHAEGSSLQLTGSVDDINAFIASGAVSYHGSGALIDHVLTAVIDDLGASGDGGSQTAQTNVALHLGLLTTGDNHSNSIAVGDDNDILQGLGGDDWLSGLGGNDVLHGGSGDDSLDGGSGDDALYGDAGNDNLIGGEGADILNGGTGHDVLIGGAGDDSYYVDDYFDTVVETAGQGNDTLYVATDHYLLPSDSSIETIRLTGDVHSTGAYVEGDDSDTTMYGGDGADTFCAGAGNDVFHGGAGDDSFYGGGGADTFIGADGDDYMEGGAGNDTASGGAGDDILYGDGGADTLNGNDGFDTLFGGSGDDNLNGGSGDDYLDGGAGADHLVGQAGFDDLVGGSGDDVLDGGDGNDIFFGQDDLSFAAPGTLCHDAGNDTFIGGGGEDLVDYEFNDQGVTVDLSISGAQDTHGAGLDSFSSIEDLRGTDFADTLTGNWAANSIEGGGGDDTVNGAGGDDALCGCDGNDTLNGGSGNDTLDGGSGTDKLIGGAGNDALFGGDDNDNLNGNDGSDLLDGGAGRDIMTGGAGADTFAFDYISDIAVAAPDTITDFSAGDKIDVSAISADFQVVGGHTVGTAHEIVVTYDAAHNRTVVDLYDDDDNTVDGRIWLTGDHSGLSNADFTL